MYEQYAKGLGASLEVLEWVNTTLARALEKNKTGDQTEIEHILDYLCSSEGPRKLRRMSYAQAKVKAEAWSKTQQKKGRNIVETDVDVETVHDFFDGTRIVRLMTKDAYRREGHLMRHCVGSYDPNNKQVHIYSYRDSKNMPHATFEVRYAGRGGASIEQIKGKGNGAIHPKYVHPILTFLKTVGLDIRPHDMQYLGYHHVKKEQLELVHMIENVNKDELHVINGETYVYEAA